MKRNPISRFLLFLTALAAMLSGCSGTLDSETSRAETEQSADAVTAELQVYCFQAGKADAFLFWNENGAVLIDTGESGFGKTILAKLQELGITRLEALILTHFDKDHVGGAKKLLESVEIGAIYQSNCPKTGASAYEKYLAAVEALALEPVTVRTELEFSLGGTVFQINPPAAETYAEDASNNSSLIISVECGENRLLFTGDAEALRLEELLAASPGRCDLIKMPHHGSWYAALPSLLELTTPAYAVITSSEEEPEDEETVLLLQQLGIQILLTRSGPIRIDCGPEGLSVVQES